MNGARDQLLARPGLTQNEHCGIDRSHFRDLLQYLAERFRRTNDFLEHRRVIDFLAQRQIFFLDSLFSLLAVLDVGSCRVPANDASVFVP